MINARVVGADLIASNLSTAAAKSGVTCKAVVRKYGALLQTRIKANASGRPGPNAPTGDYRRSWNTRYSEGRGTAMASVGTNMPQGRRLEHGFVGADSLGRVYNQPPYPHVGPAVQAIEPLFLKELAEKCIDEPLGPSGPSTGAKGTYFYRTGADGRRERVYY